MSLKTIGDKLMRAADEIERTEMDDVWDAINHLSAELKDIKSRLPGADAGMNEKSVDGSNTRVR